MSVVSASRAMVIPKRPTSFMIWTKVRSNCVGWTTTSKRHSKRFSRRDSRRVWHIVWPKGNSLAAAGERHQGEAGPVRLMVIIQREVPPGTVLLLQFRDDLTEFFLEAGAF